MFKFWTFFCGIIVLCNCLPETFKEEVRGYGNTHETVMRPRCEYLTVMAVRNMWATSKKKSTGCPESIQSDTVYDPSCVQISAGDCKLEFDLSKRDPYRECSGKIECDVGTDWQQMLHVCGSSYLENSNIMSMDYNCILSASILKFNEVKSQLTVSETYISNEEFPSAVTSSSGGTCYVTSCSTGIKIGLIDLKLSQSGSQCSQSLTVIDGGITKVIDCNDNNNLKYSQVYTSATSSIYVTFTVTSASDGLIWIDISGDRMDVYCGVTESFTPSSQPDCSTTTLSTTKTTTTKTTTTATTKTATKTTTTQKSEETGVDGLAMAGVVMGSLGIIMAAVGIIIACYFRKTNTVGPAPLSTNTVDSASSSTPQQSNNQRNLPQTNRGGSIFPPIHGVNGHPRNSHHQGNFGD